MNTVDLIRKKRFGGALTEREIREFIKGVTEGSIPDYQISAMLMAICISGMDERETLALTLAMERSGKILDLKDIPGVKADKHSTGGVGDTTTLILVPLVAACGVKMAKMSGRGLGFTGGTLDKLESIPGFSVEMDIDRFQEQVREIGCAVIGQTAQLAPADKTLYALRDVTGTVDCVPLIVSSVLSKKLAAGADVVVLDVKFGSGALAKTAEDAKALASAMVRIGSSQGKRFSALVTGMEQPLGTHIGNALEVKEAIDALAGRVSGDLTAVAVELGAHILRNASAAQTIEAARAMLHEKIKNGEGLQKLAEMIKWQGGDPRAAFDTSLLPTAKHTVSVRAKKSGYLAAVAADRIGMAAKLLGAGREKKTDVIDPAVGILIHKRIGDGVKAGDALCEVRANPASDTAGALNLLNTAYEISEKPCEKPELIRYVVE
ncbi:MAG: thymidine phosphorylase [Christensenellales bacterium]|jgi:pyrimidine-nucleoside phosphorylase